MAIFNKKTKKAEAPKPRKTAVQTTAPLEKSAHAISAIKKPHVTEKTLRMSQDNTYVFIAPESVSKEEARKQIEKLYGVTCIDARVLNGAAKKRIWRGKIGKTKPFKKIIVTLAKGQKIELTGNA